MEANYQELINSDGTFTEGFLASLPDGLGEHSWSKKYGNITDVFKGGVNQNGLVGQKAEDFWKSKTLEQHLQTQPTRPVVVRVAPAVNPEISRAETPDRQSARRSSYILVCVSACPEGE